MTATAPLPEGEAKVRAVRSMFDAIAPRYDLLNTLLTFGMDRGWRRQAVAELGLGKGSRVLDVACGPGELCVVLAAAGARPVGIDISRGMLDHARTDAPLVHGDGLRLPFADRCLDGAVSGFALRNVADLPTLWAEMARVLRPGGRIALLEVASPERRILRAGHRAYFGRVVPRVGALLSDGAAYAYLPRSVAYLPSPPEMLGQLRAAGFADVRRRLVSGGDQPADHRHEAAVSAPLVAVTTAVGQAPDLLAVAGATGGMVWSSEELSFAGLGEAMRVDLPGGLADREGVASVARALTAIECRDPLARPGTGVVALTALPFDPTMPGHLTVPRTLWGCDSAGAWVTVVGPEGATPDPPPTAGHASPPPDRFSLVPSLGHDEWEALVDEAVGRIHAGALDKVVLARRVDVEANRPFLAADIVRRLAALYPSCMTFAVEGFVGASPELLIRRRGNAVESHPLAGTVARSGDDHADDALVAGLLASAKERWEHRLVIDTLAAALAPWCESLDVPDAPTVLGLRNVSHLATWIRGRLAADPASGRVPTALEMVAEVHPTPAVGGTPTKAAIAHLQSVEGFDRGRYAGPVGWVDGRGDGAFALGIRSAVLEGTSASLYAGVGVVADSEPAAELAETQLKLQALLAAMVRP